MLRFERTGLNSIPVDVYTDKEWIGDIQRGASGRLQFHSFGILLSPSELREIADEIERLEKGGES